MGIKKINTYIGALLLFAFLIVPVTAVNWSYTYTPPDTVDVINQTGTKDWLPTLVTTGDFEIIGFIRDILLPFDMAFNGNLGLFGLIIWFMWIVVAWRNSGSIDIPLVIGMLSAGLFGMFIPQSFIFWILYIVIFAAAALIMRSFANVD
jgi:hypothetical protein